MASARRAISRKILAASRGVSPATTTWLNRRPWSSTASLSAISPLSSTSQIPVFFSKINIVKPNVGNGEVYDTIPAFRILDGEGKVLESVPEEWRLMLRSIPPEKLIKLYQTMLILPALDTILASSQRQGRISFYMTSYGEEGSVVGSAAAWEDADEVFAQYRELGVLLWRNFPLKDVMAQVFSSVSDTSTKGRQMPVHYGSTEHHFHTISSPLGTQIPQAAGAAYALKRTPGRESSCVVVYMGEGATSEGDFHAGLNMASVLGGACIFFVRNNGFAISTPASQQYRGDGIASRGPGYGIETIRVDGNDPLAVYIACCEARKKAVEDQKPILIEAMSYRVGHHSTSDDSSAYRSAADVDSIKKRDSPLFRLRRYLESLPEPLWSSELEESTKIEQKKSIMKEFSRAEKEKKPALRNMFGDVYADGEEGSADELEGPLKEQRQELKRLIGKWGESKAWKKELERFSGGKEAVKAW